MPEYGGESFLYTHVETGMEVFHIKNGDAECCCSFMFNTPSEDSKGVAHILEHTVLCGSRRFPVKDPFSQVLLSSPNTFLNAITFSDKTMYPFASPLKKDFDILFDIYSDAVFAPLLRLQSFRQEGIRYFDGHFDGVVFNEMCGARSTEDSVVQTNLARNLLAGTPYEYDSGGDPLYIVDLEYSEYLARYEKWYSPSNCRLFLFGNLDAEEYLDKLEERYLKNRQRRLKIIPKSADYMQKGLKKMRLKASCPAGDARSVILTWLTTPGDDPLEILTASTLVDILLGNPGAPLYKAIIESGLGEDLNPLSGTDVDSPVLTFSVGFSHAKEGAEDEIEEFILDQLRSYVRDGLPEDAVKAAVKRLEFKIQEIPGGGIPYGISTCLRAARTWLRGGSPEEGVSNSGRLEKFKDRLAKGRYFETWIEDNLLKNTRCNLLTVESSDDYDAVFQKALADKYALKTGGGKTISLKEKKEFETFISTPDSEEALATIGRVTISDLPRTISDYKRERTRLPSGALYYDFRLFTRGIVYVNIAFDTRNLSLEEKKLLPLLVRTMQMCGTKKHDFTKISTMIKDLTGSFFMYPSAGADVHRNPVSNVIVKAKMLRSDFEEALSLIAELLTEIDLSDPSRIRASLSDMVTEFESGYTYSGNSYAVMNASSVFSASAMESEIGVGTAQWLYLDALKNDIESGKTNFGTLSARLTKLWEKVFCSRVMTIHTGCDKEEESIGQIVSAFTDKFREGKFVRTSDYYRRPLENVLRGTIKKPLVYSVSSGPAFNALALRIPCRDDYEYVTSSLLASVLSSGYLWNTVRGENGAYGVESHVDGMENLIVFSSYRDPNVSKTLDVFKAALKQKIGTEELEYAVVAIIGKELRPLSPQARCDESFRRVLYGMNTPLYLKRRKILLTLTTADLAEAAKRIRAVPQDEYSVTVVCGSEIAGKLDSLKTIALPV